MPFTLHLYDGAVPPLAGMGVNTTVAPLHTVSDGTILNVTDGVTNGVIPTDADPVMATLHVVDALVAVTV